MNKFIQITYYKNVPNKRKLTTFSIKMVWFNNNVNNVACGFLQLSAD
jgi:hypothetical protein